MDSSQSSAPSASQDAPLPPGFLTVKQIQDLPTPALKVQQKVNVIGFVKDYQPPFQSRGTDFKCSIDVVDSSIPEGSYGLKANVFMKNRSDMPHVGGVGDVVLMRNIKAQMWQGAVSLLSHSSTEFHVLQASKITTTASDASGVQWNSYPPSKGKRPTNVEVAYVMWANSKANNLGLPSTEEFKERSMQAMNVKEKFAVLQDVKSGGFYDILGEVVRIYGETSEYTTVHISDYTENKEFYNYAWGEGQASDGREGDPHNYLKSRPKATKTPWPGPYGKRTIQLTLWDSHATFIKEEVKVGNWLLLRNVQIKYGKSGGYLEGFLRGDRNGFEGKLQVEIIEVASEPDENDPRLKAAMVRKWAWKIKSEQQQQAILEEQSGKKRKRDDKPSKGNSKARRKARREAGIEKTAAAESKVMKKNDLNELVHSSYPNEPTVPLVEILKLQKLPDPAGSDRQQLSPFHVCKYKANLRVVGFFPPKVEDFAVGRRPSEYDMLSDYSGGEDTDREGDLREWRSGHGLPRRIWEWRFALEVIDASNKASKERMWLMVENQDAQMLLNMDATNLRKDTDTLREVKEKLCILWGDLEEQKSALARAKEPKAPVEPKSSPPSSQTPGDQPPVDSDDENENSHSWAKEQIETVNGRTLKERASNITTKGQASIDADPKSSAELQVKNKGFTCCIKQYAIKVKEKDPLLADAGDGKRWGRRFGLFGTQIL